MWTRFFANFYALVLFAATVSFASPSENQNLSPKELFLDKKTIEEDVENFIAKMSLEKKIGQLFIFGYSGTKINQHLDRVLNSLSPGAIIAFQRNILNPWQIAKLNSAAQDISLKNTGLPMLIMIDQEGGVVSRIKTRPNSPSALAIGSTENPSLARDTGQATGRVLSLLGFNMNLAPVVDISDPTFTNFIGSRSFGKDPHQVKVMGQKFADGLEDSGVLPTLKHFPGHGGAIKDSHVAFPQKLKTEDELMQTDLVPFAHFSHGTFPGAIMVAHIAFPNIDSSGLPATFSSKLINGLLRERLNYNGLVITDDIEMHGATIIPSIGERAVRAIEAGNDMIMVAWTKKNQKLAYKAVLKAVKEKRISEERLNMSLKRILYSKFTHKNNDLFKVQPKIFLAQLKDNLRKLKKISNQVVKSNIDKYFYLNSQNPRTMDLGQNILVFSGDYRFYSNFKKKINRKTLFYSLSPKSPSPVLNAMTRNKDSLGVFYITGNGTAKMLNLLPTEIKKRILVVNSTHPGQVLQRHLYPMIIDINSKNYNSGGWIAEKLIRTNLRLPATLDGKKSRVKRSYSKN